jgi:hypothetical protein
MVQGLLVPEDSCIPRATFDRGIFWSLQQEISMDEFECHGLGRLKTIRLQGAQASLRMQLCISISSSLVTEPTCLRRNNKAAFALRCTHGANKMSCAKGLMACMSACTTHVSAKRQRLLHASESHSMKYCTKSPRSSRASCSGMFRAGLHHVIRASRLPRRSSFRSDAQTIALLVRIGPFVSKVWGITDHEIQRTGFRAAFQLLVGGPAQESWHASPTEKARWTDRLAGARFRDMIA